MYSSRIFDNSKCVILGLPEFVVFAVSTMKMEYCLTAMLLVDTVVTQDVNESFFTA